MSVSAFAKIDGKVIVLILYLTESENLQLERRSMSVNEFGEHGEISIAIVISV
jgi:hypothetical protein